MSTEENMALVRRYAEEGWGKKNLAVMDELVAPDMVDHNPIGMMDQHQGAEGVKRAYCNNWALSPCTDRSVSPLCKPFYMRGKELGSQLLPGSLWLQYLYSA